MQVQITSVIEDPRKTLAESETSQIQGENWQLNKPLINYNQMLLGMNTMILSHLELSLDLKLAVRFCLIRHSNHQVDTNWSKTLNTSTWRSSTSTKRVLKILQSILWLDQQVNAFRKKWSTLKMLMREKRIIENLITKEELLLSWTKEIHTLHQSANMEHLIHSERLMVLRDNS